MSHNAKIDGGLVSNSKRRAWSSLEYLNTVSKFQGVVCMVSYLKNVP